MLLPPDKIAQLLRHYGRTRGRPYRPRPTLVAIAGIACLSLRTVMRARLGIMSHRTRRLLSHALGQLCQYSQVGPFAHKDRSPIEDLADIGGWRLPRY